jgi:hypothetical protein
MRYIPSISASNWTMTVVSSASASILVTASDVNTPSKCVDWTVCSASPQRARQLLNVRIPIVLAVVSKDRVALGVVNACPNRGEPLKNVDTWEMAMCDPSQGRNCPNGYFCHKIGQATTLGYCCPGNGLFASMFLHCTYA